MPSSKVESLQRYVGRECLAIESGIITHIRISSFTQNGKFIETRAELVTLRSCCYQFQRPRAGPDAQPAVDVWLPEQDEPFTLSTEENLVFLINAEYVQLSYIYGSTRLMFREGCIALFRNQDLRVVDCVFDGVR